MSRMSSTTINCQFNKNNFLSNLALVFVNMEIEIYTAHVLIDKKNTYNFQHFIFPLQIVIC